MANPVIKTNGGSSFYSARVEKLYSDASKGFVSPHVQRSVTEAVFEAFPASEEIAEAVSRAIQSRNLREIPESLSIQRIQNYLNFLMFMRISQVRRDHFRHDRLGMFRNDNFTFPAVLWPVLCAIGDVEDRTLNMLVTVQAGNELQVWAEAGDDVMDDLYETRADLIEWGKRAGIEFSDALPRDTIGNLRVLSMFVNERGRITSPRVEDLPTDVMIRSLFEINVVENIFGLPRVEYETIEYYQHQFVDMLRFGLIS